MKKFIAKRLVDLKRGLVLSMAAILMGGLAFVAMPARAETQADSVYRFYKASTGEHFYTASVAERDNIIARWSNIYHYEGITWNRTADPTTIYRFYNVRTGDHFFTASVAERDNVNARWGYLFQYEGVGWNDFTPGGPTVYRFLKLNTGSHFYTTSQDEVNNINSKWGYLYRYEGAAWGGEPIPVPEV